MIHRYNWGVTILRNEQWNFVLVQSRIKSFNPFLIFSTTPRMHRRNRPEPLAWLSKNSNWYFKKSTNSDKVFWAFKQKKIDSSSIIWAFERLSKSLDTFYERIRELSSGFPWQSSYYEMLGTFHWIPRSPKYSVGTRSKYNLQKIVTRLSNSTYRIETSFSSF